MRRWILGIGAGVAIAVAGCGSTPPSAGPTPEPATRPADRDQLAGLAAAAKDKRYVATYTLTAPQRRDRTVTVALGVDRTWVVAIPGGALSGLADIAMYGSPAGLFQCVLGPASGTAGTRPDLGPLTPVCVGLPGVSKETDPVVHHVFTDWIDPLVDRATALSVAATAALPGAQGTCYSVESNSAAMAPPVDPGVYCYAPDGVLTAVKASFGVLMLAAPVAAAPPSVTMPAAVVSRDPLPMVAPAPPPAPTPAPST